MSKQIFRQEALERMSSPEQLDELMPVTSPRGWIALAGLSVLLVLAVLWGIFGSIETIVRGNGVLVRPAGVQSIDAPADGVVKQVLVKVGDDVKRDQVLLEVETFNEQDKSELLKLRSPIDGRVLDVAFIERDTFKAGELLVRVEDPTKPLQAILFVPTKDGAYKIEKGNKAMIEPATADSQDSNPYVTRVKSAGRYPATQNTLLRVLQNEFLVSEMMQFGPVLEVVVEMPDNKETQHIFSGTPCTASITVSEKAPIELVLPIFGK